MLRAGCHLSVANGYLNAAKEATNIGANTFQYFSRNPQGYKARRVDENDIKKTKHYLERNDIKTVVHGPYTLNLAAQSADVRVTGVNMLMNDLDTLELFGGGLYVFHPGSHTILSREVGLEYIYTNLNTALRGLGECSSVILLETMSGRGTEIGCTFEEIRQIIDGVEFQDNIGVCFDTCHVFSAGYDIVNDLDGVLQKFDEVVGLDWLKVIHLNDSKHPLGSKKDRHAKIGEGEIGKDALFRVMNHEKLRHLPFILETPNDIPGYANELKFLKENYNE